MTPGGNGVPRGEFAEAVGANVLYGFNHHVLTQRVRPLLK